ncbi:YigZ family protein [Culicoidibacter larvae]|uniref:YigZ family protein n=1 Tax=Culicoidibacter larvae TaxID=2579976 RepID=A0A5R8QC73_9FIRM|nr:YigZ family protein [Culicoidibacter larvae]TLG73866.1 YigZ family protein [Culicoidibacter larvae]
MEIPVTIEQKLVHEIVIERSRFICTMIPVTSNEEAQQELAEIKKQFWDATHNCSAYIIGCNAEIQRYSDDGEPSGTAGIPMLEVLKKNHIYNVLAVVTRYFGGIKLGAGGLVRAYSKSVSATVAIASLVEERLVQVVQVTIPHKTFARIQGLLDSCALIEKYQTNYGAEIELVCYITAANLSAANDWFNKVCNQAIDFVLNGEQIVIIPAVKRND